MRSVGCVEAVVAQSFRPVLAEVDGDGAPVGRWLCTQVGERPGLEIDHLWLVDLIDDRSVKPRQAVGPGIQSGGQNHRLPHTRGGRVGEQPVEMPGADSHSLCRALHAEPGIEILQLNLTVERLGEEVQADRANEWLGERVVDQPLAVGEHTLCGHHRGGHPHTGGEIPAVVVGPCHRSPYSRVAVTASESRIASSSLSGNSRPYAANTSGRVRAVTSQPCSVRYSTTGLRSPG